MNPEALFLYMIAAAALVLAFTNLFLLGIKKGNTAVTTGTVISISMPNPDTAAWKIRNRPGCRFCLRCTGFLCINNTIKFHAPHTGHSHRYHTFPPQTSGICGGL